MNLGSYQYFKESLERAVLEEERLRVAEQQEQSLEVARQLMLQGQAGSSSYIVLGIGFGIAVVTGIFAYVVWKNVGRGSVSSSLEHA